MPEANALFETLVARENAGPGRVVRWTCPDEPEQPAGKKITAEMRARHEARFVAQKIRELGPAGLGAERLVPGGRPLPAQNWLLEIQRNSSRWASRCNSTPRTNSSATARPARG
jgi:hypothetical protein